MKKKWTFTIGFASGLVIFISANVLSYCQMVWQAPVLTDVPTTFGFPFKLHVSSGFGSAAIIWSGLVDDILAAVFVSVFLGWLLQWLCERYSYGVRLKESWRDN